VSGGGLLSSVDLGQVGTEFRVPIYIVQGAEDLVTVPDVFRAWFDTLRAPRKRYVLVQRAGHDPNERLLAAMYVLLRELKPGHASSTASDHTSKGIEGAMRRDRPKPVV
jgi:alpha-beta hydrolase superfamily lysophospholipase